MSGPKISQAELERQRRQQLEKQREEFLRYMTQLRQRKEQIRRGLQSAAIQKLAADAPVSAQKLRGTVIQGLEQIQDLPAPDMQRLDSYMDQLHRSVKEQQVRLQQFQNMLNQEEMRFHAANKRKNRQESERKTDQIFQNLRQDMPVPAMIVGFDFDGDGQILRAQILALAKQMQSQTDISQKRLVKLVRDSCSILAAYANDAQIAKKKDSVRRSLEKILNDWQEELRRIRENEAFYQQYCVLSGILGISPRPFDGFADAKELEREVGKLKERYRKKDEMDYIASQINEVMIQLGYSFVSSAALQRKDGSEYDYSLYQADAAAGISIYTDESGAVMMQMTNLGGGAVTPQDEADSYQMQLNFCASHPDIVQALADRGVLLKQVNYLPPSKKYVVKKQVIKQGTSQVVDRRKRRRHGKKVRYMQ